MTTLGEHGSRQPLVRAIAESSHFICNMGGGDYETGPGVDPSNKPTPPPPVFLESTPMGTKDSNIRAYGAILIQTATDSYLKDPDSLLSSVFASRTMQLNWRIPGAC